MRMYIVEPNVLCVFINGGDWLETPGVLTNGEGTVNGTASD